MSIRATTIRKEAYPVSDLAPIVFSATDKDGRIRLGNDWVRVGSMRIRTFKEKGFKCVYCGIEGSFFWKEIDKQPMKFKTIYHLNLYAVNDKGNFILMTKDHIIPICKGGKTTLDNLQPMCQPCNNTVKCNNL